MSMGTGNTCLVASYAFLFRRAANSPAPAAISSAPLMPAVHRSPSPAPVAGSTSPSFAEDAWGAALMVNGVKTEPELDPRTSMRCAPASMPVGMVTVWLTVPVLLAVPA